MKKIDKSIEIVRSSTVRLSSMSSRSGDGIYAVLNKYYTTVKVTVVDNLADLETLVDRNPDLVFLGMNLVVVDHALGLADPNKVWITDYLDYHNIAYTGSSQSAQELELYKPLAKQRALDAGLRTSPCYVVSRGQSLVSQDITLDYPLFVKPANCGGGLGVSSDSVVHNFAQLKTKVHYIDFNLHSDSLVEEYLPGREFSVAILNQANLPDLLAMPIELIAPPDKNGARILSGKIKSADTERHRAVEDEALRTKINNLAVGIFGALKARDYGRIDIRLDEFGEPHFLEANLLPSLVEGYGNFPKACKLNENLDHEAIIIRIVELGLTRSLDTVMEEDVLINSVLPVLEPDLSPA